MKIRVFNEKKEQIKTIRSWKHASIWISNTILDYVATYRRVENGTKYDGDWEDVFNFLKYNKSVIFSISKNESFYMDTR